MTLNTLVSWSEAILVQTYASNRFQRRRKKCTQSKVLSTVKVNQITQRLNHNEILRMKYCVIGFHSCVWQMNKQMKWFGGAGAATFFFIAWICSEYHCVCIWMCIVCMLRSVDLTNQKLNFAESSGTVCIWAVNDWNLYWCAIHTKAWNYKENRFVTFYCYEQCCNQKSYFSCVRLSRIPKIIAVLLSFW